MKFNRFDISIIIQIFLIAVTNFILVWALQKNYLKITNIYFIIILFIQILYLFYTIRRNNRELLRFLKSIKYKDTLRKLDESRVSGAKKNINQILNEIAEEFSLLKIEKESEYHFFQYIIKHIRTGLIVIDKKGKVELNNDAFKKLFQTQYIDTVNDLNKYKKGLRDIIFNNRINHPALIKLKINEEFIDLSVTVSEFKIQDKTKKLISFQDIKNELQQEEIDTWQKLIRILTHEIMNSVGPISSLSSTLIETFTENTSTELTAKEQQKFFKESLIGLKAIEKRSEGLKSFVEVYQKLKKVPDPQFSDFKLITLFNNVKNLLKDELKKNNIDCSLKVFPSDVLLNADERLIEQILINLIKNSILALNAKENKYIKISGSKDQEQRINIRVADNGEGIPADHTDKVFIPFFSTRENGSGIGLSLSRQIMSLHGGTVTVQSNPGVETTFTLRF